VIKNLGASMRGLTGVSGGSILSDGQVGLILDVAGIIKIATTAGENNIVNKNKDVYVEV
jgi:chemotaxis protein histidine kinase CheA